MPCQRLAGEGRMCRSSSIRGAAAATCTARVLAERGAAEVREAPPSHHVIIAVAGAIAVGGRALKATRARSGTANGCRKARAHAPPLQLPSCPHSPASTPQRCRGFGPVDGCGAVAVFVAIQTGRAGRAGAVTGALAAALVDAVARHALRSDRARGSLLEGGAA